MKKKIKALKYMPSLFKLCRLSQIPVLKRRITRINKVYKPDGHKMSAYILKSVKALLLGAVFCFLGVISSTIAEDLPHSKGPFFYRADKEDKSLYLLGTLHSESLDQLQCHSPIVSFLKDSDFLFTEANQVMVAQTKAEIFADISESAEPEFNSLSKNSKRFLVNMLKSRTQNSHSDKYYIEMLQKYNFWYIANFILNVCTDPRENMIEMGLMDYTIQEIAHSLTIPQDFLDDLQSLKEYMIYYFPFLGHILTAKDINLIIDDYDQFCKIARDNAQLAYQFIIKSFNIYQTGEMNKNDIEHAIKLDYQKNSLHYSFLNKPIPEDRSINASKDSFLKNRNQKWIEKIRQSHENNDSVFIAVGVGHLIASDNILDMLREDSFSIQRMNADCSFNGDL